MTTRKTKSDFFWKALVLGLSLSACNSQQNQVLDGGKSQTADVPLYMAENWVQVPAGEFLMGSADSDKEAQAIEKPQHKAQVPKAFKISRYEVTFADYERFAKATQRPLPSDSGFGGKDRARLPVINVSWQEAVDYAQWLSQQTSKHFRLPTEAEWEYAARAGSTSSRFWGDDPAQACHYANVFDKLHQEKIRSTYNVPQGLTMHHPCEEPYLTLAPVGSFQPNAWGLFDMLGNVWEWVADCPHQNYSDAPSLAHQAWDVENQGVCTKRVVRGGSWFVGVRDVRVAARNSDRIEDRGAGLGFRLVMDD